MIRLLLIMAVVGGCATDEPDDACYDTGCSEPDLVTIHVKDVHGAKVEVTSTLTFEEGRPSFPTVHVVFWTSAKGGCPVVDDDVEVSLSGVPGYVIYGGTRMQSFRWFCDPFVIDFLPKAHQADAKVVVHDATGTIELDLGDVLVERTLVSLDHPDWAFPASQPSAFRWHPVHDLEVRNTMGVTTFLTANAVPALMYVPITSLDADGAFQLVMPAIDQPKTLRFFAGERRSCGEHCIQELRISAEHAASGT